MYCTYLITRPRINRVTHAGWALLVTWVFTELIKVLLVEVYDSLVANMDAPLLEYSDDPGCRG